MPPKLGPEKTCASTSPSASLNTCHQPYVRLWVLQSLAAVVEKREDITTISPSRNVAVAQYALVSPWSGNPETLLGSYQLDLDDESSRKRFESRSRVAIHLPRVGRVQTSDISGYAWNGVPESTTLAGTLNEWEIPFQRVGEVNPLVES